MRLIKQILEKNDCYKAGVGFTVKGLMLHSTGANNPNVSRYVPGSDILGYNKYNNHWNQPRPGGRSVCVHGFIGRAADENICTVQTLPWDMKAWHCGGYANHTHIGVEMCEDSMLDKHHLTLCLNEAADLFACLCITFNLDPTKKGVIISHKEGHDMGWASGHGDPDHWMQKFNLTMNDFRSMVIDRCNKLKEELTDMDQNKFNEMMEVYLSQRANFAGSDYAKNAMERMAARKIITNENPQGFVTREMLMFILDKVNV